MTPGVCAEEPDSPVCTCFDEAGDIDENCGCGVMLDLYEDPSSGLAAFFVGDALLVTLVGIGLCIPSLEPYIKPARSVPPISDYIIQCGYL